MSRMPRQLAFFLAMLLGCWLEAQETPTSTPSTFSSGFRTINGSVVLRGSTVVNPQVTLENSNRSFNRMVLADSAGGFVFAGVPGGDYTITIEAEGYLTLREQLEVPRGTGVIIVQYVLRPAPVGTAPTASKQASVSVSALQIPADARNAFEAGVREMGRKNWDKARERFEKALRKHAAYPQALYALAWVELATDQPERALERLRRAVEIDASYADAYLLLSRTLNRLSKHSEALETARKGVTLKADLWEMQYELGVAALSLGLDGQALEASEKIEATFGTKVSDWRLLRAGVLLKRSQYTEAKAQLVAFIQEAPPNHRLAGLAKQTLQAIEERIGKALP
jgi:hypothetical protein